MAPWRDRDRLLEGFHWIRCAEDLTSRFEACALATKVKVESLGKHGGHMASIWHNSVASSGLYVVPFTASLPY